MDPKDFRKGHKHPCWLLCSTTRTYMWLMGLRKPREAPSLCQKQVMCKKDRSETAVNKTEEDYPLSPRTHG